MLQTKFEIGTSKITLAFHYLKLGLQKKHRPFIRKK